MVNGGVRNKESGSCRLAGERGAPMESVQCASFSPLHCPLTLANSQKKKAMQRQFKGGQLAGGKRERKRRGETRERSAMEEHVGLFGTVKLTKHIIFKNWREFVWIALLLAIPYACDLIVLDLSSVALDSVAGFVFTMFKFISSKDLFLSPQPAAPPNNTTNDSPFPHLDLPHIPLPSLIAALLFSLLIPLISTPLLTFTLCRACLNQSLNMKESLLRAPRCAKNLALASLCIGVVLLACFACVTGMLGMLLGVIAITHGNMALSVAMFCILIGMGVCGVYVAIVFSLTHTVAIVEEKRGWGAMKRSMDLLNGRKWEALWLAVVMYSISVACDASVLLQWSGATILKVSLQTLSSLFSMSIRVVLYMSCKRRLDEPLPAGSPLDSLPNSMDLETHALHASHPKGSLTSSYIGSHSLTS